MFEKILTEVLDERSKQVQRWGNESDDKQVRGEIAQGAAAYVLNAPMLWPSAEFWNPSNFKSVDQVGRRGQLIRAAAMIVAEIERLERSGQ